MIDELPTGTLAFLFTDIESSTRLWDHDPTSMRAAMARHDRLIETIVEREGGVLVRPRGQGDSRFAVFRGALSAARAAVAIQRALQAEAWATPEPLRVRMALHSGEADLRDGEYYGAAPNRCARLRSLAHAGQILVSGTTAALIRDDMPPGVSLLDLGLHQLKDLSRPEQIYQLAHPELAADFPPLQSATRTSMSLASFGALLRRHRAAAGISQEELAERAGLSRRGIADLERGARKLPYAATIQRLVDALNLEPDARADLFAAVRQARSSGAELNQRAPSPTHPPIPLSSFVGRQQQIAEVCARLATSRLVTLVGAGGIGKTRLAVEVLRHVGSAGHDIAWVDLAPLRSEELVTQTVATSLGIREQPGQPLIETLIEAIASRPVLLVMDNCEHVLQACIELIDALLQRCSSLRVLGTSREPLHILGEVTWRVPALQVPEAGAQAVRDILDTEAVALFVERAQAADRTFTVTERNASVLCELCHRLDGLPLAIELAAARTRVLAPAQILARLGGDALDLLVGGEPRAHDRQQTVRATLDWSYRLLSAAEQRLFRQLAVFAGGFELEAVASVCALRASIHRRRPHQIAQKEWETELLELLTGLVDKSLVLTRLHGETMRYALLEPVRQFGLQQLEASGEAAAIRTRHAETFLDAAEDALKHLNGPTPEPWLDQLETEHGNFRAALQWCLDSGQRRLGLRIACELSLFWSIRGRWSEGELWLERVLQDRDLTVRDDLRARALAHASALAIYRGDIARARVLQEQALELRRALADKAGMGDSLIQLGAIADAERNWPAAHSLLTEALECFEELGDRLLVGLVACQLGTVTARLGDYERAASFGERGLSLVEECAATRWIPRASISLGHALLHRGEINRSAQLLRRGTMVALDIGESWSLALGLECFAELACSRGQPERSTLLLGGAAALRDRMEGTTPFNYADEVAATAAAARSVLGSARFRVAWARGRTRPVNDLVNELGGSLESEALTSDSMSLSAHEQGVAGLLARGDTDRDIASA